MEPEPHPEPSSRAEEGPENPRFNPEEVDDAPPARLKEVRSLLASLALAGGGVGGLPELREWTRVLPRMTGLSRKATLQLCHSIAECMSASRPRGTEPTRESLQQAFVRIGGAREVVNAMVLHNKFASSVAACLRCLSAAVQGAPLAAEALELEGLNVSAILRCIEKHSSDAGVAASGCELIGHLCAPVASSGSEVAPARTRAHRESQLRLASQGALDLVVGILGNSVKQVADEIAKVQISVATTAGKERSRADKAVSSPKASEGVQEYEQKMDNMRKMKARIGVRQLWQTYAKVESASGRVQEAALQALVLLATGNPDVIRMLAGTLWVWDTRHNQERKKSALKKRGSRSGSKGLASSRGSIRQPSKGGASRTGSKRSPSKRSPSKQSPGLASSRSQAPGSKGPPGTVGSKAGEPTPPSAPGSTSALQPGGGMMGPAPTLQELAAAARARRDALDEEANQPPPLERPPEADPKTPMAALEAVSRAAFLELEVLRGRACRDRPALTARCCRVLGLVAAHHAGVLRKVARGAAAWARDSEILAPVRENSTSAEADEEVIEASFVAMLLPAVSTLTETIRTQRQAPEALTAATEALGELRQVAMLATPEWEAERNWQALIARAQQQGELQTAAHTLQEAAKKSDVATSRMTMYNLRADQLQGSGTLMSPRMRKATLEASVAAQSLFDDTLAAKWSKGDPELVAAREAEAKRLEEEAAAAKKAARWAHLNTGRGAARQARKAEFLANKNQTAEGGGDHSTGADSAADDVADGAADGTGGAGSAEHSARTPAADAEAEVEEEEERGVSRRPSASQPGSKEGPPSKVPSKGSVGQLGPRSPPGEESNAPVLADAVTGVEASQQDIGATPAKRGNRRGRQDDEEPPKDPDADQKWLRALGYFAHDEADFDRCWRQPLTEIMTRSFSTPAMVRAVSEARGEETLDSLDRLLELEMIDSEPGRIRARVTVQPPDRVNQTVLDGRVKELSDHSRAASFVTNELSKMMRRNRCLLPRYGMEVTIKRTRPMRAPGTASGTLAGTLSGLSSATART